MDVTSDLNKEPSGSVCEEVRNMPRSKKSYEERIDEKDEEIRKALEKLNQIKEQKKDLEKLQREKARKERTRRLIIIGGIAEKALGREFVDGDDTRFERFLYGQESRGNYYSKAMSVELDQMPAEPSADDDIDINEIIGQIRANREQDPTTDQ